MSDRNRITDWLDPNESADAGAPRHCPQCGCIEGIDHSWTTGGNRRVTVQCPGPVRFPPAGPRRLNMTNLQWARAEAARLSRGPTRHDVCVCDDGKIAIYTDA